MRTTVIAAAVLLLVSGCSHDEAPPRRVPVSVTPSSADTALTPRAAAEAFRVWRANDDLTRAAGDSLLAQSWSADSQAAITAAQFRAAAHADKPVARHVYGEPTLWVPRLSGYPQWFVASVPRDGAPVLMAFVRRNAQSRFRLDLSVAPAKGVKIPKVAVDSDGYASAVSPEDGSGLLTTPETVASLQSAVADEGAKSFSARVVEPGPYTTGLFDETARAAAKAAKKKLKYGSTFTAPNQPIFPLRLRDGGVLVLYPLVQDIMTTSDAGPVPVPPEAAHLVTGKLQSKILHVVYDLQFATVVPPKPAKGDKAAKTAKADVIARGGAPVGVKSA